MRLSAGTAAVVLALLVSGCGSGPAPSEARETAQLEGVSALDNPTDESFPTPLIDLDDLLTGGPPPDGIPSIDEPRFDTARTVDWLEDDEPLLSLTLGGETRGYPLRVMTWHEIVNDTVGDVPVTVTYCPLCNSGVAFERTVESEETTFGVSGFLYADNLVMYDRATESLWPQLTGVASVGVRTGLTLESIPLGTVGWDQFREAHPDALVLNRDTGHQRDYGRNPYPGYDEPGSEPLFPLPGDPSEADERLGPKTRVIGLGSDADAIAVTRAEATERGVVEVEVAGAPVTVWHLPGQTSALDTADLADGAEIGTVATYDARLRDRTLTFRRDGRGAVRDDTGSTWNAFGRAVSGPLAGSQLRAVKHLDTFWFAWVAFQPQTMIVGSGSGG
ncbi:DUF3179 domain-containing protein [Nocardioides sp.]|uniref:DUF3179 domain-containing protein n=1 Tax=Nocardioides sp. TaxID=35761 RepID=UPI002B270547|nr:DUF3179 domain-containing protein [Nocardioides sp.]